MAPFTQAGMFLIDTIFTFFMLSVLLRILLEAIRADYYNPISQMVLKVTNYLLIPVRRIVPPYKGIDWASVVLVLILAFFKEGALILLSTGTWGNPFGLLLLGLADVLDLLFYIYLFTLIAVAASNWLNPTHVNPLIQIASQIITPLLKRIRFDLAPFFLAILLILFNILIIQTIAHIGVTLLIPA